MLHVQKSSAPPRPIVSPKPLLYMIASHSQPPNVWLRYIIPILGFLKAFTLNTLKTLPRSILHVKNFTCPTLHLQALTWRDLHRKNCLNVRHEKHHVYYEFEFQIPWSPRALSMCNLISVGDLNSAWKFRRCTGCTNLIKWTFLMAA